MQQPLIKKYVPSFGGNITRQRSAVTTHADSLPIPDHVDIRKWLSILWQRLRLLGQDEAIVSRYSTHIAVFMLAVVAITISQLHLPQNTLQTLKPFTLNLTPMKSVDITTETEQAEALTLPSQLASPDSGIFFRSAVPHIVAPIPPREDIAQYTIQKNDTVYGIAYKFNITPETLVWSNPVLEENPHWLQVGQAINILPFDGIYHQVGGNDTIEGIAATYKVNPDAIIYSPLNEIDQDDPIIEVGQWIVVPGGSKPFIPPKVRSVVSYGYSGTPPANAPVGSGIMTWPVTGRISQGYYGYHPALDIESPIGAAVASVDSGFVIAAGWDDTGYGYHVVIDHGNGLQSMYAHLQSYSIEVGDVVRAGQTIGAVGMSGRSSGPHLHVEIRQGTIQLNPAMFLP
jgi:LysM repeat protein